MEKSDCRETGPDVAKRLLSQTRRLLERRKRQLHENEPAGSGKIQADELGRSFEQFLASFEADLARIIAERRS